MKAAMGPTGVMLIALGGVTYTLGAIIYARRWPDPWVRCRTFLKNLESVVFDDA